MVQNAIGSTTRARCRSCGVHHNFQQCRNRGSRSLLQPRNALRVSGSSCRPICSLELRNLKPSKESLCPYPYAAGRILYSWLTEERGDRLLRLAPELCAVASHLELPEVIWSPIPGPLVSYWP